MLKLYYTPASNVFARIVFELRLWIVPYVECLTLCVMPVSCLYCRSHCVCVSPYVFFARLAFFLSTVLARGRVLCLPSVLIIVFSFCCVWLVCLRLCLAFMFLACACACLARVFCLCIFPCVWCLLSSHVFCIWSLDTIVLCIPDCFQRNTLAFLIFSEEFTAIAAL